LFDARLFAIVRAATIGFLQRRKALFDQRAASGKLRDCHGDLRADHIYFTDAGVRIIDCIEFNQRFRFGDPASDLAFLAMDLDARGHGEIARDFLAAYVRRSGDADLLILRDFYKCYRAMVRFKVDCIRILEPDVGDGERSRLRERIAAYLALAYGYAVAFTRPVLWVVCGMPASGKSTIAEALGHSLNIPVLRSDAIRKTLFAPPPVDPSHQAFEGGIYTRGATALTYGRMFLLAQAEIEKGRSVILDATFGSRHFREEALRLAADMDATIFFVECAAPDPVLKERLRGREGEEGLSDARLIHFDAFRETFEPLDEIRPDQHLVVHTENSVDACLERILYNETIAPGASAPPGAP
jgi:predicted kinase